VLSLSEVMSMAMLVDAPAIVVLGLALRLRQEIFLADAS
jgi:hypothetical protein